MQPSTIGWGVHVAELACMGVTVCVKLDCEDVMAVPLRVAEDVAPGARVNELVGVFVDEGVLDAVFDAVLTAVGDPRAVPSADLRRKVMITAPSPPGTLSDPEP